MPRARGGTRANGDRAASRRRPLDPAAASESAPAASISVGSSDATMERGAVDLTSLDIGASESNATSTAPSSDTRTCLFPDDQAHVLEVLRNEQRDGVAITRDKMRFVVRQIASHSGKRQIAPDFPTTAWVNEFASAHGLSNSSAGANQCGVVDEDSGSNNANSTQDAHQFRQDEATAKDRRSEDTNERAAPATDAKRSDNSTVVDCNETGDSEPKTCGTSRTIPVATWVKAIVAVEQNGVSLRRAATMHGVHFNALHRRVKKRAEDETHEYLDADDEAGIVRVAVARADLGVPMTMDELNDLVERIALQSMPYLTVQAASALLGRFQTRNEESIHSIILDWPPPSSHQEVESAPPGAENKVNDR